MVWYSVGCVFCLVSYQLCGKYSKASCEPKELGTRAVKAHPYVITTTLFLTPSPLPPILHLPSQASISSSLPLPPLLKHTLLVNTKHATAGNNTSKRVHPRCIVRREVISRNRTDEYITTRCLTSVRFLSFFTILAIAFTCQSAFLDTHSAGRRLSSSTLICSFLTLPLHYHFIFSAPRSSISSCTRRILESSIHTPFLEYSKSRLDQKMLFRSLIAPVLFGSVVNAIGAQVDLTSVGALTPLSAKTTICNVLDYGGVADNSTDIGPAILSAFTNCAKAGGATLYVPPGSYSSKSTIPIPPDSLERTASSSRWIGLPQKGLELMICVSCNRRGPQGRLGLGFPARWLDNPHVRREFRRQRDPHPECERRRDVLEQWSRRHQWPGLHHSRH